MINIDYSFLLQALSLFLFFLFMRRFLFRPLRALLEKREARIEGAEQRATWSRHKIAEVEGQVAESLRQAADQGEVREKELVAEAGRRAGDLTAVERERRDAELRSFVRELEGEQLRLQEELSGEAQSLGRQLAAVLVPVSGAAASEGAGR